MGRELSDAERAQALAEYIGWRNRIIGLPGSQETFEAAFRAALAARDDVAPNEWQEGYEAACDEVQATLGRVLGTKRLPGDAQRRVLSRGELESHAIGDYEYRLSWECASAACLLAHQEVLWESLTADEWNALPWEKSYRIADGGDIFTQRQTLEGWAEDHYQPVRNVRLERRIRPNPDEGWSEVAVRGATGVTHWKATGAVVRDTELPGDAEGWARRAQLVQEVRADTVCAGDRVWWSEGWQDVTLAHTIQGATTLRLKRVKTGGIWKLGVAPSTAFLCVARDTEREHEPTGEVDDA